MIGANSWNFVQCAFNGLLIHIIARPILFLMRVSFSIFNTIARVNIFSDTIYNTITSRMYAIISVVMLFVFAYQIILLIINPDGETKAMSGLAKDLLISAVLIILLPTIFSYASIFQKNVVSNNTIPAIILGTSGTDNDTKGNKIVKIVFTTFFHPTGTDYHTFYDDQGNLVGSTATCESQVDSGAADKICSMYIDGLQKAEGDSNIINAFTGKIFVLSGYDGDGFDCSAILLIGASLYVTWLFLSYAIDLGVRAVKLFALEIIAPVPVILRILPKSKGTFDKWLKEIMKTYLEVFFRLAFIFLVILICSMVPEFLERIFTDNGTTWGEGKGIATVILILGICKFAKEAPEMLKKVFDTGGGMLAGINFKPGVKSRIQDNEYAMRGLNGAMGAAGGYIGRVGAAGGYQNFFKRGLTAEQRKDALKHNVLTFGRGTLGGVNGARRGIHSDNRNLRLKDLLNQSVQGAQAAEDSVERLKQVANRGADFVNNVNGTNVWNQIDKNVFGGAFGNASSRIDAINADNVSLIDKQAMDLISKLASPLNDYFDKDGKITKFKEERTKELADARAHAGNVAMEEAKKLVTRQGVLNSIKNTREYISATVEERNKMLDEKFEEEFQAAYEKAYNTNSDIRTKAINAKYDKLINDRKNDMLKDNTMYAEQAKTRSEQLQNFLDANTNSLNVHTRDTLQRVINGMSNIGSTDVASGADMSGLISELDKAMTQYKSDNRLFDTIGFPDSSIGSSSSGGDKK